MGKFAVLAGAVLIVAAGAVYCDEMERPAGFEFIVGPRVGVSWVVTSPEDFSETVSKLFPGTDYFPVYTLFGINFEQRILLGETNSHFAFQELVLVGGLEQSVALPVAAFLIGYRAGKGFEFGIGPLANLAGVGVVAAIGWTLSFRGVFVPIDLSVILPNRERPVGISFTTGFNFKVRRRLLNAF